MHSIFARAMTIVALLALVWASVVIPSAAAQTVVPPPVFSAQRGFYTSPFSLTLSSPGATIRYTLDGNTPSPSVGTIYSAPISIATVTAVRAIAYTSGTNKSAVVTHTYIFLAAVRTQSDSPPAGWPSSFAASDADGTYPSDYGMDPEVTEHPLNVSKFDAVMKSLPSISIVTDLPNLWQPSTGIYYNPNAKEPYTTDPLAAKWERPISIELINPDGSAGFAENGGMRIQGQASRRPHRTPKKSLRIYFKKAYGVGSLDFQLFPEADAVNRFDRLVLRNGGNRSWPYFDRDQRREADYINDEWARRAWGDMGHLTPHGSYVHLYLNGLYWGLYNVAERIDEKFLASHLGLLETDYDLIEPEEELGDIPLAGAGTIDAYNELLGLVAGTAPISDAQYQTIATKVDVVNLADYFIHAHYIGKTDWPWHNWNAYRQRIGPDTRFKFIPWDNDSGFDSVNENNTLAADTKGPADAPVQVFLRLTSNAEFRQVLADRLYKHVVDPTGALAPAQCATLYTGLATTIDQAVIGESARWGDYMRDKYPATNTAPKGFPAYLHSRDLPNSYTDPASAVADSVQKTWVQVRNEKLSGYCPNRSGVLAGQYSTNGWYQTSVKPPTISQRGGTLASGMVTLGNSANSNAGDIYYTVDGNDPRAPFGGIAPGAVSGGDSATIGITRATVVKARVLSGTTWSPPLEYTFAPTQPLANLVINELMYFPTVPLATPALDPKQYEFIELYNSGSAQLQLDALSFLRGVNYQFPANTTIAPGQYLVLASNPVSFQQRYGFAPFGGYTGSLSNSGETVELIDAVGGPVDRVTYGIVAPWPAAPNGTGSSLSLIRPALDNTDPTSWGASLAANGTPGAANGLDTDAPQTPSIGWSPASITYGTALGAAQFNAAATSNGIPVAGSFSYSLPAGTMLGAGNGQLLSVVFTPSNTARYTTASASVAINVARAPLTITADSKVRPAGGANSTLTASYSGFVNGDDPSRLDTPVSLSTTATAGSAAGTYPIVSSGAADANYTITFVNGALTVTFVDTATATSTPTPSLTPTATPPSPSPTNTGMPTLTPTAPPTATPNATPSVSHRTYLPLTMSP